jgi:ATP-dependent DNA helicase PIF1
MGMSIGDGTVPVEKMGDEAEPSWITIPPDLLIHVDGDKILALITEVYPNFIANNRNYDYLAVRAIICPNNSTVDDINERIVSMVPGSGVECISCDTISKSAEHIPDFYVLYPTEFLNSINAPNFPCHKLVLKEGAMVMLLRNLNQTMGLCNGTRLLISQLGQRVLRCIILT